MFSESLQRLCGSSSESVLCVTSTLYAETQKVFSVSLQRLCGSSSESVLCVTSTFV